MYHLPLHRQVIPWAARSTVDNAERKSGGLPEGLFRVGIGIFWPIVGEDGLFRTNRSGDPRPKVNDCHLSTWLIPEKQRYEAARCAFNSFEEARDILVSSGEAWFHSFSSEETALSILEREDWELFWHDPMMRGYSARSSTRRFVLLGTIASRLQPLLPDGVLLGKVVAEGVRYRLTVFSDDANAVQRLIRNVSASEAFEPPQVLSMARNASRLQETVLLLAARAPR